MSELLKKCNLDKSTNNIEMFTSEPFRGKSCLKSQKAFKSAKDMTFNLRCGTNTSVTKLCFVVETKSHH